MACGLWAVGAYNVRQRSRNSRVSSATLPNQALRVAAPLSWHAFPPSSLKRFHLSDGGQREREHDGSGLGSQTAGNRQKCLVPPTMVHCSCQMCKAAHRMTEQDVGNISSRRLPVPDQSGFRGPAPGPGSPAFLHQLRREAQATQAASHGLRPSRSRQGHSGRRPPPESR